MGCFWREIDSKILACHSAFLPITSRFAWSWVLFRMVLWLHFVCMSLMMICCWFCSGEVMIWMVVIIVNSSCCAGLEGCLDDHHLYCIITRGTQKLSSPWWWVVQWQRISIHAMWKIRVNWSIEICSANWRYNSISCRGGTGWRRLAKCVGDPSSRDIWIWNLMDALLNYWDDYSICEYIEGESSLVKFCARTENGGQ